MRIWVARLVQVGDVITIRNTTGTVVRSEKSGPNMNIVVRGSDNLHREFWTELGENVTLHQMAPKTES
jgi:hypothetical protein